MLQLKRTNAADKDLAEMIKALDADLALRDGEEHAFYDQFNKIDSIKHVVILYDSHEAVACGALKKYDGKTVEVKRMYTLPASRGKGFAGKILEELELWASKLLFERCILETGIKQPEAIRLYQKSGYLIIPNYGQYIGKENSICFEKKLK